MASGRLRQLTRDAAPILGSTWSEDGRHLLVASERSLPRALWRVAVGSGALEWLPAVGDSLSDPTLGGGRLVAQRFAWDTDLSILRPPGPTLQRIEWLASSRAESHPAWSPDCARLAFVSSRHGEPGAFVADLEQRTVTAVGVELAGSVSTVDWSPDGSTLVVGHSSAGRGQASLVDLLGSSRPLVTGHADVRHPIFAPDGASVVFSALVDGRWQLWRHQLATGRTSRLTAAGGWRGRFDPRDGSLYFSSRDSAGLYRLTAAGALSTFDPLLGRDLADFWATSDQGPILVEQAPGARQQALHAIEPGGARRRLGELVPTASVVPQLGMSASPCSAEVVVSQLVHVESDIVELVEEADPAVGRYGSRR
jgi:hypothetical protein